MPTPAPQVVSKRVVPEDTTHYMAFVRSPGMDPSILPNLALENAIISAFYRDNPKICWNGIPLESLYTPNSIERSVKSDIKNRKIDICVIILFESSTRTNEQNLDSLIKNSKLACEKTSDGKTPRVKLLILRLGSNASPLSSNAKYGTPININLESRDKIFNEAAKLPEIVHYIKNDTTL
jgi:hypothetical protein